MALAQVPVYGVQEPRIRMVADADTYETGVDCSRFFRTMTGRDLVPWQDEVAIRDCCAERWIEADGYTKGHYRWAATDVGIIVSRQNGKGDVLMAIALYHLFVLKDRRIFWTAQLQKTATDAHSRMAGVIRNSPKLFAQLYKGEHGIRNGKGDERIVLADGREIIFFTRSDNAGRGLYGDLLILDEAYDLTDGELAALRPLIKTAKNPQVIYTSTPVDGEVMPNGDVLARVRARAMTGKVPRLTWLEWSIPDRERDGEGRPIGRETRTTDPAMLALGNPSLGYLFGMETLEDDLTSMGARKFLVEDLCAPDYWPNPEQEELDEIPFDIGEFGAAARADQVLLDPVALAVDRSPGGWTSLTAAGWHEDGTWGSETIYHRKGPPDWVIPEILKLVQWHSPAALVVDGSGPSGALVAKLQAAGLDPIVTGASEMGRASQAMVDDFGGGRYVPPAGDSPLMQAVEIARWRDIGSTGARAFARKGFGDISPLVGAALAGFGLNLVVAFRKKAGPGSALTPVALGPASVGADWSTASGVSDLSVAGLPY
jgi:hypothetical protein